MRCFYPRTAYKPPVGSVHFKIPRSGDFQTVQLRCGQCIGCRLKNSRVWGLRCVHEAKMHAHSCYVTLTLSDEHLVRPYVAGYRRDGSPAYGGTLDHRQWQLFAKKVRNELGPFRFLMCGEYGEKLWRPHYHAIMFGVHFPDRVFHQDMPSGFPIYRSAVLSSLWTLGFASVGDCTMESSAYVARYVTKKVTGDKAATHYRKTDLETGEVIDLKPEYSKMSLKPGLGATWWDRYRADSSKDYAVSEGQKISLPRYYDKLLERQDPEELDWRKIDRDRAAILQEGENAPDRLRAQEAVARARLSFKKRSLE